MSSIQFSHLNEFADPGVANQTACVDLSLLFTLHITGLIRAVARTGGKPLADQFQQQLNRYAGQHGWSALTGLTDLAELQQRVPEVDARMLLSVYLSYVRYARVLVGQILGEQMLRSILVALLTSLPVQVAELNKQYGIISL